jgi:hydrogenase maturation protease
MMPEALVIGYGNELRGDDAAGPLTVREIAALNRPNLRALAVHQLMPELAEPISRASAVVFVDARLPLEANPAASEEMGVVELEPQVSGDYSAHYSDPAFLLGLAARLYGHCPRAWLATIPAEQFELGVPLSSVTLRGIRAAVISIPQLLEEIKSVPGS